MIEGNIMSDDRLHHLRLTIDVRIHHSELLHDIRFHFRMCDIKNSPKTQIRWKFDCEPFIHKRKDWQSLKGPSEQKQKVLVTSITQNFRDLNLSEIIFRTTIFWICDSFFLGPPPLFLTHFDQPSKDHKIITRGRRHILRSDLESSWSIFSENEIASTKFLVFDALLKPERYIPKKCVLGARIHIYRSGCTKAPIEK